MGACFRSQCGGDIVTGESPLDSSVTATIDLSSIDTGNPNRDNHIRSADFFEVDKHKTMSFRSTGVRRDSEDDVLDGELTLRTISEPISLRLEQANGSGETLVTFRLPAEVQATTVSVVGEFNDWSTDAHRMRREDDAFTAVIPLMAGRAYRFRYLLDGERWLNDWAADAYVPNEFGGDDSLVDLTDLPPVELPSDRATVEVRPLTRS